MKTPDGKTKKRRSGVQPFIRNMGLYWNRDYVSWGRQGRGNKGELLGRLGKRKPVEFWEQAGIYALYMDYKLVYVGQVGGRREKGTLGQRLRQHMQPHDLGGRWNRFSWFGFYKVNKTGRNKNKLNRAGTRAGSREQILNALEGICLEVAEPPQNGQKGRFGKGTERYLQYHAEEPETQEDILEAIGELKKDVKALTRQVGSTGA